MRKEKILKFPDGFLWGVSTSAYQTEGGNVNDWSEFEKSEVRIKQLEEQGKNPKDYICGRACDSYNRYEEDFELAKKLNCGAFRLGLEWSRIEPKKGEFDLKEILHYREVLRAARQNNLKIVLTLWHWTLPLWLFHAGGWGNKKTVEHYARYVELMVKELGEYVDYWVTLNEPLVHLTHGYLTGKFPPNRKYRWLKIFAILRNFISAHQDAYEIIKRVRPEAKVGLTALAAAAEPAREGNPLDWFAAKLAGFLRNDYFLKKLSGEFDFIGADYYHHLRLAWRPPFKRNENKKLSDFGWEIYPKGIYQVLMSFKKYKKPILILENGLADARDRYRKDFIIEHLRYVHEAIKDGAPVIGYFHWSLIDNFEWADGWLMKFGLYAVDRKTFKRVARPSAKTYSEICQNNLMSIG